MLSIFPSLPLRQCASVKTVSSFGVCFDLPSDTLEIVHGLFNKQFDVSVCDILNKDIMLPTPLLPLSVLLDVNSKVYGAFSLIIPSVDVLNSFLSLFAR